MKLRLLIAFFLLGNIAFSGAPSANNSTVNVSSNSHVTTTSVYNSINWKGNRIDFTVFEKAYTGFLKLKSENKINNHKISIIDYSLASTEKRLWVIDLNLKTVLYNTLVSHGRNTGENYANNFSNTPESYKSSLGFFVTGATYIGKHGLSLYLDGVEKGVNDNARSRHIVIHGANYVSQKFVNENGRLGRSLGCPALPENLSTDIINVIANKSCLFSYYSNKAYLNTSAYLVK